MASDYLADIARRTVFQKPVLKPVPGHWKDPIRQVKLDGVRVFAVFEDDGPLILTRGYQNITHKLAGIFDPKWVNLRGTLLDCELVMADGSSAMAVISGKDVGQEVQIFAFDILYARGYAVWHRPQRERLALLNAYFAKRALPGIVRPIPTVDSYETARQLGHEGIVIKNPDGKYHIRGNWIKQKPVLTYDARVTDIKPGRGKYKGLIGSILIQVLDPSSPHDKQQAWASGFTDEDRRLLTELFKGMDKRKITDYSLQVEVSAQSKTTHNRLRHPRITRIRWDLGSRMERIAK